MSSSPQQQQPTHGHQQNPAQDNFFKTVGDYHITKLLGEGKFGQVRLASHIQTKEQVAVKIVQRAKLKSKKDVDHINREIMCMKVLRHPHVVLLKEALQTANNIYLFMELVEGGDLIDRVQKEVKLSEKNARKFFQQLVVAVRYCHSLKIVHRDLKLDNLMVDKSGDTLKVADFGLANLADEAALMHTVVGSPHYVAPEVLKQVPPDPSASSSSSSSSSPSSSSSSSSSPSSSSSSGSSCGYDGFACDCWSMGVILYTLLSGHYPFDNPNRKKLFELICAGEFRMSRSFTPASEKLIANLLKTDVNERYTINDILNDEWFKVDFNPSLLLLGEIPPRSITPQRQQGGSSSSSSSSSATTAASNGGDASPVIGSLKPGAGGEQHQPQVASVNFKFVGDIESCQSSLLEIFKKLGCLLQTPEMVAAESAGGKKSIRRLCGYCSPKSASKALQVFQAELQSGEDPSTAGTTQVTIENKVGPQPDFEVFAKNIIQNLGAKVGK